MMRQRAFRLPATSYPSPEYCRLANATNDAVASLPYNCVASEVTSSVHENIGHATQLRPLSWEKHVLRLDMLYLAGKGG